MKQHEVRYRVIAALLQSDAPLSLQELAAQCGIGETDLPPVLGGLAHENLVVEGKLLPDRPPPQYCWRARWEQTARSRTIQSQQTLQALVAATEMPPGRRPDIDDEPVLAFHDFVINRYTPPKDKRFLVFLQCSVRRPFSSSPSHASMRRAISAATGHDPSNDFESCPVHIVVLASRMGPVPYELEDVYPANVRGGGLKHFGSEYYARVRPVLAERMAQYIAVHGSSYDHISTFTESRYGEVMAEARQIAGVDLPVLPVPDGPRIIRMGRSKPRTYWQKYWIQLYLEIVSWLPPDQQAEAEARLGELDVRYDGGTIHRASR